jgi:Ca2+-binding RTX toxin-like protein
MSGPQNTIGAGTDTLVGIENLTGSGFADTLFGDAWNNTLIGGSGNDRLTGQDGRDTLTAALATICSSSTPSASQPPIRSCVT